MDRGDFQVVTSTLTLTEVLVQPYRNRNPELATKYYTALLNSQNLRVVPVSSDIASDIASDAASIRAARNFRTPDAIQIATARRSGATSFFTNDVGIASVAEIPSLQVLVLKHLLIS